MKLKQKWSALKHKHKNMAIVLFPNTHKKKLIQKSNRWIVRLGKYYFLKYCKIKGTNINFSRRSITNITENISEIAELLTTKKEEYIKNQNQTDALEKTLRLVNINRTIIIFKFIRIILN